MVQRDHQRRLRIWRQIMAEKNRLRCGARKAPKTKKNAASPKGSGVFLIMKSLKRKSLSLAGLAATYSPRA
jgi:hypothetical protein